MRSSFIKIFSLSILLFGGVACKRAEMAARSYSIYSAEDFGELPLLPGGESFANGQLTPMISDSGRFSEGVLKKDSKMVVGTREAVDKVCALRSGTKILISVLVVTRDQKKLLVMSLPKPCTGHNQANQSAADKNFSEGYISFDDVNLTKDYSNTSIGDSVEVGNNQESELDPEYIGDNSTPLDPPSQNQQGPDTAGCFQVEQGSAAAFANANSSGCNSKNIGSCAIPGNSFRSGNTGLLLAIYGKADKWSISTRYSVALAGEDFSNSNGQPVNVPSVTIKATDYTPDHSPRTLIPFDRIVGANNWLNREARFEIQGLRSDGVPVGSLCVHTFRLISPVVLDLSGTDNRKSLEPYESKVQFDLDANGSKEKSGWILPHMGLLALDRNHNGRIDHGGELFGEFTIGKKSSYKNGYEALAELDSDGNGFLDRADPQFAQLLVWTDLNMDAVSQAAELKSLKALGISKIDVTYRPAKQTSTAIGNKILYESKYYGPKHCVQGCMSYDIYFGTTQTIVKSP